MQVLYPTHGNDASNILLTAQKRLIRVVEGQTQATPYACFLDPSLRNADGSIRVPKATDTEPLPRTEEAFTYMGSIVPGTVLLKGKGENVIIANGQAEKAQQPFGLLGQWVGGAFDNVHNTNEVSAWRGPDAVIDLVAPAFNDEGLTEAVANAEPGERVDLYAGADGRLTVNKPAGEDAIPVAYIIEVQSSAVIRVNLVI